MQTEAPEYPVGVDRLNIVLFGEHEPLAAGSYRLIKEILLDGQPGMDLSGCTRTAWCPFTLTEHAAAGSPVPVPARRERDAIDGRLFAIDLFMQKA